MGKYYASPISDVLYHEVEAIVTTILEHPKQYRSRKSIQVHVQALENICEGLSQHQAAAKIAELTEELKEYCKQGGQKLCGTAFVMQCLYELRDMAEFDNRE